MLRILIERSCVCVCAAIIATHFMCEWCDVNGIAHMVSVVFPTVQMCFMEYEMIRIQMEMNLVWPKQFNDRDHSRHFCFGRPKIQFVFRKMETIVRKYNN